MEDFETQRLSTPVEEERVFGEPFEVRGRMIQVDQHGIVDELYTVDQNGTAMPPAPIEFPTLQTSNETVKVTFEGSVASVAELLAASAMQSMARQQPNQQSRSFPMHTESEQFDQPVSQKRTKPTKRTQIVEPTAPKEIIRMKRPFKFRKFYKRPILAATAVGIALVSGPMVTSMSSGEAEAQKCMEHGFLDFASNPGCMIGQFGEAMNPKNIFHYGPEDVK